MGLLNFIGNIYKKISTVVEYEPKEPTGRFISKIAKERYEVEKEEFKYWNDKENEILNKISTLEEEIGQKLNPPIKPKTTSLASMSRQKRDYEDYVLDLEVFVTNIEKKIENKRIYEERRKEFEEKKNEFAKEKEKRKIEQFENDKRLSKKEAVKESVEVEVEVKVEEIEEVVKKEFGVDLEVTENIENEDLNDMVLSKNGDFLELTHRSISDEDKEAVARVESDLDKAVEDLEAKQLLKKTENKVVQEIDQKTKEKMQRRKTLKGRIPIKEREDRIAKFLQGKTELSLSDIFTFYNPNDMKLTYKVQDYLSACEFGGQKYVSVTEKMSYREFRNKCTYLSNKPIDLSDLDKDTCLLSLEIFVGISMFSNLKLNRGMLFDSQNGKWNNETIALLELKNDFTVNY